MAEMNRQGQTHRLSWLPFIIAASVLILFCLIGNPFENHWFVFLFSGTWLIHLLLLLLFPRNTAEVHAVIAISCLALLCRFALLSAGVEGSAAAAKFVSVLFDLGALAMLIALLYQRRLELRWSILYATNPVVLYAFAGQGNLDAVGVFFLLGAIGFYDRRKWCWMFLFAGLCMSIGWVSAAAIPFLFRRENWKHAWIAALTASIAWLFYQYTAMRLILFGLPPVVGNFSLKGPIHALIETVSGNPSVSGALSFILLCLALLYGYRHLHPLKNRFHATDPVSGCFFAVGAYLLFSRNVSVGYLSWVIPFLALRPSASWALLSLTIGAGFWGTRTHGDPGDLLWIHLLIWIPFWMLFSHNLYLAWHRKNTPADSLPSASISVVIPVINEADRIEACIAAAKQHPAVQEIIVVDGGSEDNTVEKAQQMHAVTVKLAPGERNRGRGGQIYRGIQSASKDLVAIVHADIRVNKKMFDKMLALMAKQPMFVGGAVGSVFDASGWRFRLLEIANDFRMVCMGISFGDQVQFFRRKPVIKTDLFPDIPLMEDVEFAIRLHRLGRQAYLFGSAEVSTRKWEKQGMGHALTVIRLFGTYLLQRLWKTPDTHSMYRTYYGN